MGVCFGQRVPGFPLTIYPNIIDQLALQSVTNSRAFSLDLGSIDVNQGS